MIILLRNIKTSQFLAGPQRWTNDRREALAFQNSNEAICLCNDQGLADMEVVLAFDDPEWDVRVRLAASTMKPNPPPPDEPDAGGAAPG
jgi:hypothetical protein